MVDLSKRNCLKAAGASLAALSLGIGGTIAADSGNAAVDRGRTPARTDAGAPARSPVEAQQGTDDADDRLDYERDDAGNVEFDYNGVSFETTDGDSGVELTIESGDVHLDFEVGDGGDDIELVLEVEGERIDFEVNGEGTELTAYGATDSFEDDSDLEYRGEAITLEYDPANDELEVTGTVTLDYDGDEFEWHGPDVSLEWTSGGEFEATKA